MRLSDEWDTIEARRGREAAAVVTAIDPQFDPWSQIEARRGSEAAAAMTAIDPWARIEARRAADSVSHAKNHWLPVVLVAAGIWVIFNSMNGRH